MPSPDSVWKRLALEHTGADDVRRMESVQSLWSGYGEIFRAQLVPTTLGTIIVKHIAPFSQTKRQTKRQTTHPRGWDTDRSTQRKLRSYEIESHWYAHWSPSLFENPACRIPECLGTFEDGDERWILLEDLDACGFDERRSRLPPDTARHCLSWLANFHGNFMGTQPDGLWPIGTYWHLDTRPDEYDAMQNGPLKQIATALDALLNRCEFQTIVHGDAKVANFCFSRSSDQVAAVDFQYVGGGCGMKDVAYFIGSCLDEAECERWVPSLLDHYFTELRLVVANKNVDRDALESEWRDLFAPAWTDFHRFLLGWVPSHPKIHRYTRKLTEQTLARMTRPN